MLHLLQQNKKMCEIVVSLFRLVHVHLYQMNVILFRWVLNIYLFYDQFLHWSLSKAFLNTIFGMTFSIREEYFESVLLWYEFL